MKLFLSSALFLLLLLPFESMADMYFLACFTDKEVVGSKTLQQFFDQADKDQYPTFDLNGKRIVLDKTVRIKKVHARTIRILGNNALIECKGGWLESGDTKGMRVGVGGENDIMSHFDTYHISNIHFLSKGSPLGLRLVGTYQSRLEQCTFRKFTTSADLVFCMQMLVQHCEFHQPEYGLVLRSGMSIPEFNELHPKWFSNANPSNCSSNRSQIEDCRFFARKDTKTLLRVDASDGVNVENCIFEGFNPIYAIHNDHRNSTTVTSFYVSRPHFEFAQIEGKKTEALIKATTAVLVHLEGIYSQFGGCVQVDADALQVVIDRPVYLPLRKGAGLATEDTKRWKIIDAWNNYTEFFDPLIWKGESIPEQLIVQQQHNTYTHGVGITQHELKGGTMISQGQGRIQLLAKDYIFIEGRGLFPKGDFVRSNASGEQFINVFDPVLKRDAPLKLGK